MALLALQAGAACGDSPIIPPEKPDDKALTIVGEGPITTRYTTELWVHGQHAYVGTGGTRLAGPPPDAATLVWDVSGNTPVLVDSLRVEGAGSISDVQVSDDGSLLVVATHYDPGTIEIYDLTDPAHPVWVSRFANEHTQRGVHTAEVARVNGSLYAFLSTDPFVQENALVEQSSRLMIVNLDDPAQPTLVYSQPMGNPFIHDVHVRDGRLYTALWNGGLGIYDISVQGTPAAPVQVGSLLLYGNVHSAAFFRDAAPGSRSYVFVGEEKNPFSTGVVSTGNVYVLDVTDPSQPQQVGVYTVPGAGAHNFSIDEQEGILYVSFYNGGVRALDIRGTICPTGSCDLTTAGRELGIGLKDVNRPVFVWGVHVAGGHVYASDMLNGLWKLGKAQRP